MSEDLDLRVRLKAFAFLDEQSRIHEGVVPWSVLLAGFSFDGRRVPLVSQQGIFKPAVLPDMPLSIRTAPPDSRGQRPYDDGFAPDSTLLFYRYRRDNNAENARLRLLMQSRRPLVYLHGIMEGRYMPFWPVYVVADDAELSRFCVQIDDTMREPGEAFVSDGSVEARREYITTVARRRLHQASFRARVLTAYRRTCALCRLKHDELLDAAHIVPDSDPLGEPHVANGLALCKFHHAAFDRDFLGIRPDLVVEIRRDILDETDGPMLRHGLQGFHGRSIWTPTTPTHKPSADLLELRYERFRRAS